MTGWFQEHAQVYFGNATATRDLRTQMRGSRGPLLFTAYLGLLVIVTGIFYSQSVPSGTASIVQAQESLVEFFQFSIGLIAVMMHLAGPALTATAVVAERQRRSLDLLFSAPIRPRYFLIGKMIASYRTLWLLLVLSLPITAACVVLGGATWGNVLEAYLLLSLHGLIFTALSLLASCLATKPAGAFTLAFAFVFGYAVVTSVASSVASIPTLMTGMTQEAPFIVLLSPFLVPYQLGTYSVFDLLGNSIQLPNWILFTVFALLICKLCLLASASILSPFGSQETASLRRNGLLYFAAYAVLVGTLYDPSSTSTTGRTGAFPADQLVGMILFWSLAPVLAFLPTLACYGIDGERKHWPDGIFRLRTLFRGTPAGGLPYLLLLILIGALCVIGTAAYETYKPSLALVPIVLLTVAFWIFAWSVARAISATRLGVKPARTLTFTAVLALVVAPYFLLLSVDLEGLTAQRFTPWLFYPLWSVGSVSARPWHALGSAIVLLVIALGLSMLAQRWTQKRFPPHVLQPDEP